MAKCVVAAVFILLAAAAPGLAASDLGVPWAGLPVSLNIASARVDGQPLASNGTCDEGGRDLCRWTAPEDINFVAQSDGVGHLERIEADWDSYGHPGREAAFRSACLAIASLAHPRWSKAQAVAAAAKTMVIAGVRGSVAERQQTTDGVRLFGDRNAPAPATRPNGAFLQCGAWPDV